MSAYEVRLNFCNCHPETCCCNTWAVYQPDGTKHSTFCYRSEAYEVAQNLNIAAPSSAAGNEGSDA